MPRDRARGGSREQTRHLPLASGLASENGSRLAATSSHSQGCVLPGPRAPPSQMSPHFLSPPGEPLKGQPWPLRPDGWEIRRRKPFVHAPGTVPCQDGGCAEPAVRVDLRLEKYSSSLDTSAPAGPLLPNSCGNISDSLTARRDGPRPSRRGSAGGRAAAGPRSHCQHSGSIGASLSRDFVTKQGV